MDETPLHEPVRGSRGEQEQLLDPGGPGSALEVLQELIAAALVTVPGPHRERRNLRDRPRLLALGTLSLAWAALVPTQRRARDDLPVPLHHREIPTAHLFNQRLVAHHHRGSLLRQGFQDVLDVDPVPGLGGPRAFVLIPAHHRAHAVVRVQLQQKRARDGVIHQMRPADAGFATEHRGANLLRAPFHAPLQPALGEPLPRG